jgi:hypothetical protein
MEITMEIPDMLPIASLHGDKYCENTDSHNASSSPPSSPSTAKPITHINDATFKKLSILHQANATVIKDHTETITVAEGLTRELQKALPFQGITMKTLEQVEQMAEQAEQTLEGTIAQVKESNKHVLEQEMLNLKAYQTYKRNREEAQSQITAAQNKRQKVESGIKELSNIMLFTMGDADEEDDRWLETALQTTEGCKQLLDRQIASMQEIKKEKKIVMEETERLSEEIEPLQTAVKDLREIANNGGSGELGSNEEMNAMSELKETCDWYENVNRLICGISGTSVIHRPDAFHNHSLRIRVDSTLLDDNQPTASATLEVCFEPNTTNVVSAKVRVEF